MTSCSASRTRRVAVEAERGLRGGRDAVSVPLRPRHRVAVEVEVDHPVRARLAVEIERLAVRERALRRRRALHRRGRQGVDVVQLPAAVEPGAVVGPQDAAELGGAHVIARRDRREVVAELGDGDCAVGRVVEHHRRWRLGRLLGGRSPPCDREAPRRAGGRRAPRGRLASLRGGVGTWYWARSRCGSPVDHGCRSRVSDSPVTAARHLASDASPAPRRIERVALRGQSCDGSPEVLLRGHEVDAEGGHGSSAQELGGPEGSRGGVRGPVEHCPVGPVDEQPTPRCLAGEECRLEVSGRCPGEAVAP